MSDYKLPDLPSDEELGISEEDRKALEEEEAPKKKPAERPTPPPAKPAEPAATPPSGGTAGYGWRGPLTLVLLLLLGWATSSQRALPHAAPLAAPDTAFSSGRAMLDLVDIARRAHPPGSPEHARVRAMLVERLESLGLVPEVQVATSLRRRGDVVHGATVRNVLARVPGTASTGAVLLTAHYDSRGIARGAGDDGSGVATILETLRAVRAGEPLQNDLIVLLTDGEELGLLGARAFVEEHPWLEDVAVVLSVEMRGGGGPSNMFETGTENGWIIGAMAEGDPRPFANSMSTEIYRRMPNDTDFTPFRERGVQGLNFAGLGNAHVYHQAYDAPDRFDERTLQHHGLHVLGMVRELGGRDLSDVDAPDRVYLTLPLLGLVTYPPAVGYGVGMLLLIAAAGVFLLVRRGGRGGLVVGLGVGFLLAVATVAVTAAAAYFLFRGVTGLHPEYGSLHGSAFHVEGWYVAAVVAAGVAVAVMGLHLLRDRLPLAALALGALLLPLLGALFLTFAAPLAAMNLQWPVLLALAGAALVAGVGPGRRPGLLAWLGLLVVAAGIAAIAVPLTELVWQALTFEAAAIVGGLVAVWLVLLLPLLDTLREPGGWWAPATGLVAAALFVGVGILHARPTPERPAPSTLLYVLDRDSARAVWAIAGRRGADDELGVAAPPPRPAEPDAGAGGGDAGVDGGAGGTEQEGGSAGGSVTGGGPATEGGSAAEGRSVTEGGSLVSDGGRLAAWMDGGAAWALVRAGATPGALSEPRSLEPLLLGADTVYRTAPAEVAAIPAPAVSAVPAPAPTGAEAALSRRRLLLRVHSAAGAETVAVRLPASADVFLEAVNGQPVPEQDPEERTGARRARTVVHWGMPPGADAAAASVPTPVPDPVGNPPAADTAAGAGAAADAAADTAGGAVSPAGGAVGAAGGAADPALPAVDPGGAAAAASSGGAGAAQEPGVLELTLDVGPGVDTLPVEIIEHHLRPGELVGERHFLRPPRLAPDVVRGSDRAILHTTVVVDPATGSVTEPPPGPSPPGRPLSLVEGAPPVQDTAAAPAASGGVDREPASVNPSAQAGGRVPVLGAAPLPAMLR